MDYKERYEELLKANRRLEEELASSAPGSGNTIGGSKETIFNAFHSIPHLMAISRLDTGQYIDVNKAFLSNIGYSKEEIVGHTPDELGIFADIDESSKYISLIPRLKKIKDFPVMIRKRDKSEKPFLFSAETITLTTEYISLLSSLKSMTHEKIG